MRNDDTPRPSSQRAMDRLKRLIVGGVTAVLASGAIVGISAAFHRENSDRADDGHAMTGGLLLSSAGAEEASRLADTLWEHAAPHGWGLPYEWDAYRDGTVNPETTAYAITTALVLNGLLDAGLADERAADVAVAWAGCCWSDGFFWYSDQPHDAIYTPNVSSMLAGVIFRFVHERPDLFALEEREALSSRANSAMTRLFATARPGPEWAYSDFEDRPNDLLHHVYTLWGAELYRQFGGSVPWSADDAARAMRGREDTFVWPAAAPAMRYAFASCWAPKFAQASDLEREAISARDAAHRALAC